MKIRKLIHENRIDVVLILILLLVSAVLRMPGLDIGYRVAGDELMWGFAAKNIQKHPLLLLNPSNRLVPDFVTPETQYPLFNRSAAYPLLISLTRMHFRKVL